MAKFKVGDKVKRTAAYTDVTSLGMVMGYEGKVTSVSQCGDFISVDGLKTHEQNPFSVDRFELIETEETQMATPVLNNMKIRIKDAIHSRMVQEALLDMGYKWNNEYTDTLHVGKQYLYAERDGSIMYGDDAYFFVHDSNEEVELVTTYSFKPVDQEAKRKAAEKEALQKNVAEMQKQLAEMQKQLDEMKQKLEVFG